MELEHLSQKTGLAKIQHLVFIAHTTTSREEANAALKLALQETIKSTKNTALYKQLGAVITEQGHSIPLDEPWCEITNKNARHQYEVIQEELQRDRNNGIKEKIRLSHLDMGNLFFDIGEYVEAQKNFMKSKEYCTIPEHMVETCLQLAKVNWMLKNYGSVESFCSKGLSEDPNNDEFQAFLGLCFLIKGRYEQAIDAFQKVNFISGKTMINCAISINDIARYGVICAVTSLSRPALVELSKNDNFREYLELEPVYRDLLHMVTQLRYKEATIQFKVLLDDLKLDCYAGPHVDKFVQKLKVLAVTSVFNAFEELQLSTVADLIGEPLDKVLPHVENMILSGVLQARIDARTGTVRKYLEKSEVDIHEVLALVQLATLKSENMGDRRSSIQ